MILTPSNPAPMVGSKCSLMPKPFGDRYIQHMWPLEDLLMKMCRESLESHSRTRKYVFYRRRGECSLGQLTSSL